VKKSLRPKHIGATVSIVVAMRQCQWEVHDGHTSRAAFGSSMRGARALVILHGQGMNTAVLRAYAIPDIHTPIQYMYARRPALTPACLPPSDSPRHRQQDQINTLVLRYRLAACPPSRATGQTSAPLASAKLIDSKDALPRIHSRNRQATPPRHLHVRVACY
jgi:hypothetical protein